MGSESWKQEIGFEEQLVDWDTEAVGTIAQCEFFRFFEGHDIWMTPEIYDVTGTESTRDKVDYAPGVFTIRGRRITNIELVPDRMHHFLEALFGAASGAGTVGDPYILTPAAAALPDYTIWMRCGDVYTSVVGTKVHSCEFTFESGILKASLEIRAKSVNKKLSSDNPFPGVAANHSNKQPFVFWGLTVQYGAYGGEGTIQAKSASLVIENGLPDDDFVSGLRYTTEHTEGVRMVTGNFQVTFDNYTKLEAFIASAEKSLTFQAQNANLDTLKIEIPRVVHTPDVAIAESENLWRITMPFEAFKKDGVDLIKGTLWTV